MLPELPIETQRKVRSLRILMEFRGNYSSCEQRDDLIDHLKYDISDIVISILIKEDNKKLEYFLKNE